MMMTAAPFFRFATTRPIMAGLAVGMALLLADRALSAPLVHDAQVLDKHRHTCSAAISRHERVKGIPKGLLHAISLAESGRWVENSETAKGESFAWPWTVTTGGQGYFLPNRADAVAFVKSLQADGVENIDVGCMQINLKYHPDAFVSIEQAFVPEQNAAYAANFLKSRYDVSKSWIEAAGDYHSTTPERHRAYAAKISALWQKTAQNSYRVASVAPTAQPDYGRTQRLNQAFQMRRSGADGYRAGQEIANRVRALKPGYNLGGENRQETFAQRRQAQLARWRQNNVN